MRVTCIAVAVLTASVPAHADDPDPCSVEPPLEPVSGPPPGMDPAPVVPPPAPVVAPVGTVAVRGKLRQKSDGQPVAGGTVVMTAVPGRVASVETAPQTVISDESGEYVLHVAPGTYTLTIYYLELTVERSGLVIERTVDLGDMLLDETRYGPTGCTFGWSHGPELSAQPFFGLTISRNRAPVARDRTHVASVALVTAADLRTTVTTIDRGVRLHGAPGIPSIFVEETGVSTLRTPIWQAMGSGGATDVSLRSGSNETRADVRVVLGLDRTPAGTNGVLAQEAFLGAPIKKDHAWIAFGLAADVDRRAQGLLRFNVAPAVEHQGEVVALAQDTGTVRDGWTQARWVSKFRENKLQLRATATAEHLELTPTGIAHAPVTVAFDRMQRLGGAFDIMHRYRALGYHTLELFVGGGAGTVAPAFGVAEERHGDVSLGGGDSWQIRPNLQLDVGARSDVRTFAGERTTVVSPRVSLAYDLSKEGRSDLFVAVQRVPHLDDGFLGAWRGSDVRFHDELAAGISHLPAKTPSLMLGVAGRAQRREASDDTDGGLDAWLRLERKRTFVHLAASTLNRAATVNAQRTIHKSDRHELAAAATGRTARVDAENHVVSEGGAAVSWSWRPCCEVARGTRMNATVEMYDGTRGPGARLVLGGTW